MKILLAIAGLVAASIVSAHGAALDAVAGLGGLAKAGRWTPLVVSVAADRDALDAELVVVWGDTRLTRPVTISAGTRKTFELYLRTSDPRATIDVHLQSAGHDVATVRAPIRVLGGDDHVTLCVVADVASSIDSTACTATVLARALPRSPRGYEVADDVVWPGTRGGITVEQDAALRAWQALEALDASGDLGATPQVSRPLVPRGLPAALTPVVAAVGAAYAVAMLTAALLLRARCVRLSWTSGALAVVTLVTCGAIAAIGRVGGTRTVHIHHVTLLQQLPDTHTSVLTVRGIAEFPAFDRFAVRLPSADGTLETSVARGPASGALDGDGYPIVAGVFGMAGRQSFAGEAVVADRPLAVEDHGATVAIENHSKHVLRDCRLGRGLTGTLPRTLAPGARIDASWTSGNDEAPSGPVITCISDEAVLPFTEARRPVAMHGETTIAAYRGTASRGGASD
jgi:hypothetical protein